MSSSRPHSAARNQAHVAARGAARHAKRPVVGIPRAPVVTPGTVVHRPHEDTNGTAAARDSVAKAVAEGPRHPEKMHGSSPAGRNPLHTAGRAANARKPARQTNGTRQGGKSGLVHRKHTIFTRKNMFRLRHSAQLLIILACLVWGGYQITSNVLAQPEDEPSSVGSAVVQDGQMLDSEYPGLPTAVAEVVKAVVATQRITGGDSGPVQNGFAGSGVAINDHQILTAGHNVEDGKGLACSQTLVLASGVLSRASATKEVVNYASVEYGDDDDIAVLQVAPSSNFRNLPDVKLAQRMPQAGETVYFINYQPAADGTARTPFAKDTAYAEPAVFSASVLGTGDRRFAVATGGGKSFGRGVADVVLRKGASGGAIVNGKGELVGLSVASQSLAANRSAASILKEYQVNLPEQNYQVAYMQQVDGALVGRLQTGMVSCGSGD